MLGEVLADSLGKKAGDRMEIQGADFKVVGVFRGGSALEAAVAQLAGRTVKLRDGRISPD